MSQIWKFVNFTKTHNSRYLENKILFFLQIKTHQLNIKGYFMAKNTFAMEVTVKDHLYFRFTPFPDEINDLIFLKSQKNLLRGHF